MHSAMRLEAGHSAPCAESILSAGRRRRIVATSDLAKPEINAPAGREISKGTKNGAASWFVRRGPVGCVQASGPRRSGHLMITFLPPMM